MNKTLIRLAASLVISAGACSVSHAGAVRYTVTDLGTLGGDTSAALGISPTGVVVGMSDVPGNLRFHAFSWQNGTMTDLGAFDGNDFTVAYRVNSSGQAVGQSQHGAVIYEGGHIHPLAVPHAYSSWGLGINKKGHVAGYYVSKSDGRQHAFVYTNGRFKMLSGLPDNVDSNAVDINNRGDVVGTVSFTRAYIYAHGVYKELGTLGGYFSEAAAVSKLGQVTGRSAVSGGGEHAFVTQAGVMTDLGTLGGRDSWGHGINTRGQVVGQSTIQPSNNELHAFVTRNDVMHDLNHELDPASGAGWTLQVARAINDAGQIAGEGIHNGQYHSFLLTPIVP